MNANAVQRVQNQLRDGERIVSNFGPYYATSQRILVYMERAKGKLVRELPYSGLEGIRVVNVSNHALLATGTGLIVASLASMVILGFVLPLLGVAAGVYLLLMGAVGKPAYYQIEGPEVAPDERWVWQVNHQGSGSFIASVRMIVGEEPPGERWT